MAELCKVDTEFILKWEGGLSKNNQDTASKDCVPDGSGYHTNKGITWTSWKQVFGNDIKGFYEMKPDKWLQVYKKYFVAIGGEFIGSQVIAELFADWCWMSGSYAKTSMQKWLNQCGYKLTIDGDIGQKTINALNELIQKRGNKWCFESAYAYRVEWVQSLAQFPTFGKGWMRRLNDMYLRYGKRT